MRQLIFMAAITALFLVSCAGETSAFPTDPAVTSTATTLVSDLADEPAVQPTRQPGCTVQTNQPTSNPTVESLLPALSEEDWSIGPSDALVTILEYGDFQ